MLGRGSMSVQGGGLVSSDGLQVGTIRTSRPLPARLNDSEQVAFYISWDGVVRWLRESPGRKIRYAYCTTSDGKTHKKGIPGPIQRALERQVEGGET